MQSTVAGLPDKAVGDPAEDFLNREAFANALADQVLNAPQGQTLRIGIYAGWGEGKTSVLKLMQRRLEAQEQVCLWITPWASGGRTEVLGEIVKQLKEKLKIDAKRLDVVKKASFFASRAQVAAEKATWWSAGAAELFGPVVSKFFGAKVQAAAKRFFEVVQETIASRRVIVFIDDIDRVKPELVPDLLLSLRESLDQPNFFYVMALAPDVVERGLNMVHQGWGTAGQFLEKIVEYPRYLPVPSDRQVDDFVRRSAKLLGGTVDQTVLHRLVPLLPRNPRKIKLFLRLMASLHAVIHRFDSREIDLHLLYLAQLFRSEFPEPTARMLRDKRTLEDLERGYMHDYATKLSNKVSKTVATAAATTTTAPLAPEHHLESDDQAILRERFKTLYDAVRNRDEFIRGSYDLATLFALPDDPPLMTWKELNEFLDEYGSLPPAQRTTALRNWLERGGKANMSARARAIFDLSVKMRQSALSNAVDANLQPELEGALKEVASLTDLLQQLTTEIGAFSVPVLPFESWGALLDHVGRWSHFTKLEHKEMRRREAELLHLTVSSMADDLRAQALTFLQRYELQPSAEKEFRNLLRDLRKDLRAGAAQLILKGFRLPEGLEPYWGDREIGMKAVLFDPDSVLFQDEENRREFLKLADESRDDLIIQSNFVQFLQMILYGAVEGGSFDRDRCRQMLHDKELMKSVWSAAVATPLNPRTAGGLRERLARIKNEKILADVELENLFPLPSWWKTLEEVFFSKPSGTTVPDPNAESSET